MAWQSIWPERTGEISSEVFESLESQSRSLILKRGEFVYRQGESPQGVYFVQKGLVGLVLIGGATGKEHLLRFFRTGQFFGHRSLFSDEGYHGSTVVLEPTEIMFVPKSALLEAMEKHPFLYRDVLKVMGKELRRCELQHVMILENQIIGRVAQALIYLKDLYPIHNWTRQEIANFCASTVSTVIKALAQLEEQGMIRQSGRSIEILDREGLLSLQDRAPERS